MHLVALCVAAEPVSRLSDAELRYRLHVLDENARIQQGITPDG